MYVKEKYQKLADFHCWSYTNVLRPRCFLFKTFEQFWSYIQIWKSGNSYFPWRFNKVKFSNHHGEKIHEMKIIKSRDMHKASRISSELGAEGIKAEKWDNKCLYKMEGLLFWHYIRGEARKLSWSVILVFSGYDSCQGIRGCWLHVEHFNHFSRDAE